MWETWLIYIYDITHWSLKVSSVALTIWYTDSLVCVTWLIHTCDRTHLYVRQPIPLHCLIHMCDIWMRYSFICVTWLIHMCDMTLYMCDMTHSYVWHDAFICVTWLIHMCDMTHSYLWNDVFICVTWLFICATVQISSLNVSGVTTTSRSTPTTPTPAPRSPPTASGYVCPVTWRLFIHLFTCVTWPILIRDYPTRPSLTSDCLWLCLPGDLTFFRSFICVRCLILICNMTQSYMWHGSFICVTTSAPLSPPTASGYVCPVTWPIFILPYVCRNSFLFVKSLNHTCDMTHSYVWHDSFIWVSAPALRSPRTASGYVCPVTWRSFLCVTSVLHMYRRTHSYAWHASFICVTCPIPMCDISLSYV